MSNSLSFSVPRASLPPLPYDKDALAPYISLQTIEKHHEKYHQAYVDNLNKLVVGTKFESMHHVEDILMAASTDEQYQGIFNNAAQFWNHAFYWHSMHRNKPDVGPVGDLKKRIIADFGSVNDFLSAMKDAALSRFGSGWAWLVFDRRTSKLSVVKTLNADNPMVEGLAPILTLDVWEHAYCFDYANRRAEYVEKYLAHLINWNFAEKNLGFYTGI